MKPFAVVLTVGIMLLGGAVLEAEAQSSPPFDADADCWWESIGDHDVRQWVYRCDSSVAPHVPPGEGGEPAPPYTGWWGFRFEPDAAGGPCWKMRKIKNPILDAWDYVRERMFETYSEAVAGAVMFMASRDVIQGVPSSEYVRCPDDETVSPERRAAWYWESAVTGIDPVVAVSPPEGRGVPGLPVYVMVEGYQPAGDVDSDPRTVTFDIGLGVQVRGTATHMVDWGEVADFNEFAYPQGYVATNGRDWMEGDAAGPTGWDSDGQPVWQGPVQPLAMIYQTDGERTVTTHVRFAGQWRVGGGAWQDLPLPPLERETSTTFTIEEWQAELTG